MADLPEQVLAQAAQVEAFDAQVTLDQQQNPDLETPPAPPETPPEPPPPPAMTVEDDPKFKTLKGKYDTEVPRLHDQVRALTDKVAELQARPSTPEPAPEPVKPKVTPQDAETFGADLIDVIQRVAHDTAASLLASLQTQLTEAKSELTSLATRLGGVAESVVMTAKDRFLADLTARVGDLEAINSDPRFIEWCGRRVPGTKHTYQVPLDEAFGDMDVDQATELLNLWKSSAGLTPDKLPPPPSPLEEMIQPPRSQQGPDPVVDPGTRIWSQDEIAQHYRDSSKGHVSKEDAARIDKEIDLAVAQGRVK